MVGLLAPLAMLACSADVSSDTSEIAAGGAALRAIDALALATGTRETLISGITAAENQLFSAAGRLYVSGDDGVFELTRTSAGGPFVATSLVHVDGCKFGGMSQRGATLYAVCYDGNDSYLYAAAETARPAFQNIFKLDGVLLANGMASDGASLYVSATGQGAILRLPIDPNDPMHVTARAAFSGDTGGLLPNGLKIRDGLMYWGDVGTIHRASLASPALSDAPIHALTFFDDFWVDDRSVLVADFLFSSVLAYSLDGVPLGATPPGTFGNPSSVVPANGRLGFGSRDLIVTEKGTDSVAVFHD
jgi:hypothetical protein